MNSRLLLATANLALVGLAPLHAQGGGQALQPAQAGSAFSVPVPPAGPDLPQPPSSLRLSGHGPMPAVPAGAAGLPQPTDAPTEIAQPNGLMASATDIKTFSVRTIGGGGSRSKVAEPAATIASNRTAAFATGNWFAAHSGNAGASWTRVNPYTRFPASDGGFCCDQRVLSIRQGGGPTFWFLQYSRNSAGNNRARIAISKTPGDLQANRWSHYTDFTAQSFRFPTGNWLDFPDIAVSNQWAYFASNVFAGGTYSGSVVWRAKIADLVAGGNYTFFYYKSDRGTNGSSFRLTQGAGARMHWASHRSSTQLRVHYWDDSSNGIGSSNVTISQWSGAAKVARDTVGNNWGQRADSRILGGCHGDGKIAFAWHSAPIGSFQRPHVRIAVLNATTRAVERQRVIWNNSLNWMYPAIASNPDGGIAVTLTVNSEGRDYPRPGVLMIDEFGTTAALVYASGTSTTGTGRSVWGDYVTVNRHNNANQSNMFVSSGMANRGSMVSYMAEFGREGYRPGTAGLRVLSQPSGVAVALNRNDRFNQASGTTPFLRSYAQFTQYTLTAPATATIGGVPHVFSRWQWKGTPESAFSNRTAGLRTLNIGSIGTAADSARAIYVPRRTLTIRSTNPSSGTTITVSPTDISGNGSGRTTRTLYYPDDRVVTLTAPSVAGINPFRRWLVNGSAQANGVRTVRVTLTRNTTVVAEYRVRTRGFYTSYGRGCPGTNNIIPVHTGSGTPEIGNTLSWDLSRVPANLPIGLHFSGRQQAVNLAPFGMPGCTWLVVTENVFNGRSDLTGRYQFRVPIAVNTSWIGANLYTQYGVIDPGGPGPLKINWSNGLRTTIGGVR